MRVVLQDFKYGRIMRLGGDHFIGDCFALYGEYSEGEIDIYRQYVKTGDVVLDIGANIGACTIPLAQMVGKKGRVYAFEPQRVIHQILCGNIMLNNIFNVYAQNSCIGQKRGKTKIADLYIDEKYTNINVGVFSIKENPGEYEVDIISVDDLNLKRCNFIKCDTEGMGLDMLIGAENTIKKFLPVMYIEQESGSNGRQIIDFLHSLNYSVYKHNVNYFNKDNYFRSKYNGFLTYDKYPNVYVYANFNWLCLPPNQSCSFEMVK